MTPAIKALLFFAAVALIPASFIGYELHTKHEWQASYGETLDAYRRAYNSRDDGTLLYETRRNDLEVAINELDRQPVSVLFPTGKLTALHRPVRRQRARWGCF
jgi:hypothetical protein